jgi:hypothetical protein
VHDGDVERDRLAGRSRGGRRRGCPLAAFGDRPEAGRRVIDAARADQRKECPDEEVHRRIEHAPGDAGRFRDFDRSLIDRDERGRGRDDDGMTVRRDRQDAAARVAGDGEAESPRRIADAEEIGGRRNRIGLSAKNESRRRLPRGGTDRRQDGDQKSSRACEERPRPNAVHQKACRTSLAERSDSKCR